MSLKSQDSSVHSSATRVLGVTTGGDTRVHSPGLSAAAPTPESSFAAQLERGDGQSKLGRYVILRVLGRGGMGVVFSAFDEELDRRVAIKLLSKGGPDESLGRARMKREAQALARLSHPNVVQIYDMGHLRGSAQRPQILDFMS